VQLTSARVGVRVRDIVLAVLVGVLVVSVGTLSARESLDAVAYALLVGSSATLIMRRRHPAAVLVVTAISAVAYARMGHDAVHAVVVPMMVALFTAAAQGLRRWAIGAAAATLAVFVLLGVLTGRVPAEAVRIFPGWLIAVLVAGEVARSRRDYLAEVERRAAEAERTREEEARRRATEERLRIAREVHDVLSHSISMINVQAGVAVHLLDTKPEQARTALVAIKQASKDALRDLRTTLGVLRGVDDPDGMRGPAGSLQRLDELVVGAQAAGLELQVSTSGEPRELPAGIDLAAYRIVQESVSNIVRHAGPTRGVIALRYAPDALTITVDNDRGEQNGQDGDPGAGTGIRGMRERAEALGGEVEAGHRADGGYQVRARLPLDGAP
jgi:signal transduction histidine kinase